MAFTFKLSRAKVSLPLVLLGLAVFAVPVFSQEKGPVVVRPGAPGQPSTILPADTRPLPPPISKKDVEFMQGMIHHHAQAVEMVALMEGRTTNADLRRLGARISQSQSDEMNFMKRWLAARGQPAEMKMAGMDMSGMSGMEGMDHSGHKMGHSMMMPGMLTAEQMAALKASSGAEFDRLFLTGMIQHHGGALTMVKELFDTPGSGQDAELFNFATDVDSGQRAEIRIMEKMLGEKQ
ncbi:MAG TPA: DUF305 domain-containing protein [Pyrinomonadaceae bacterium]|nr:DUF305 domain-containing protein [Pyrinomonadaceae bacterium]